MVGVRLFDYEATYAQRPWNVEIIFLLLETDALEFVKRIFDRTIKIVSDFRNLTHTKRWWKKLITVHASVLHVRLNKSNIDEKEMAKHSYMQCPTEIKCCFSKRSTDADLTDTLYIDHKTL